MKEKNADMFLYTVEMNENLSMFNYILNNCSYDEKYINELMDIANFINDRYKNDLPLPSGRYGNILAYSIEMQKYYASLKIFEKMEMFGIDASIIAHSPVGERSWSLKECFEYSSDFWEENKLFFYQLPTFNAKQFIINKKAFGILKKELINKIKVK